MAGGSAGPEIGINDVLIEILKTAICGTDVHIWDWDAWAQRTIPVPMDVGHEFVGPVAAFGSNVHDVEIGEIVSGEGPYRLWPVPQLPGRSPPPVQEHQGGRREPAGLFRRVPVHPR